MIKGERGKGVGEMTRLQKKCRKPLVSRKFHIKSLSALFSIPS